MIAGTKREHEMVLPAYAGMILRLVMPYYNQL